MSIPFEKVLGYLTKEAEDALFAAGQEARLALRQDYLGQEHLLLGLAQSPGVARAALVNVGLRPDELRERIRAVAKPRVDAPVDQLAWTETASAALTRANAVADPISTADLLLAILDGPQGLAAELIAGYEDALRQAVGRQLKQPGSAECLRPRVAPTINFPESPDADVTRGELEAGKLE